MITRVEQTIFFNVWEALFSKPNIYIGLEVTRGIIHTAAFVSL